MANLSVAKQLISRRGVSPPGGISPGTPEYDQWAQAWLEGAIDAGDPEAVMASGGRRAEGATDSYSAGGISDFGGAADPSSWMGQRKPSPRELRRMAQMQGWSEDFNRFDDRQLAAWINSSWDVGSNAFRNAYGDLVQKPTESGANTPAGLTGEGVGGRGGGGGGGGAGAAAGGSNAGWNATLNAPAKGIPNTGVQKPDWGNLPGLATGLPGQAMTGGNMPDPAVSGGNKAAPIGRGSAIIGGNMANPVAIGAPRRPSWTGPPLGVTTNTSSLSSMMAPLQGELMGSTSNPLLGMMGRVQKKRPGTWF